MRKWMILISILVVLSLFTSGLFIVHILSDEEPQGPSESAIEDVADKAMNTARRWSEDSILIDVYGCEFYGDLLIDLHPMGGLKKLADADEIPLDGRCSYWRFTFHSSIKGQFLFLSLKGNGDEVGNYDNDDYNSELFDYKPIEPFPVPQELLEQISSHHPEQPNSPWSKVVIYWLNSMNENRTSWIVYRANRTGIEWLVEQDPITGMIENEESKDMSFLEALQKLEDIKGKDLEGMYLLRASTDEYSGFNPNFITLPTFSHGYPRPPDQSPSDGRSAYWSFEYFNEPQNMKRTFILYKDGRCISEDTNLDLEKKYRIKEFNRFQILDSDEIMGKKVNYTERGFSGHGKFLYYSIAFGDYKNEDQYPVWTMSYNHSPDCIGSTYLNAVSGEVKWNH